ncbi:ABC transporter permease [Brachybacterium timonense]|uniref:ABC transporter permease n=1 Tax=Brachybacterium timonense TaxID=2050896 RepID=UPI00110DB365|nr:ABC transporter permease [Brachybacterium timonense]
MSMTSTPRGMGIEHRIGEGIRQDLRQSVQAVGSIRIPEFLLFFLLVTHSVLPIPSIGFPIANLLMVAAVGLALLRRPTHSLERVEWIIPVMVLGLFYVCALSMFAEPTEFAADWQGRALRIAVTFVFALVIGSGRICLRSGLLGYTAALILNVPLFLAGLLPAPYGQYLTGFIGDKNVAGMVYCIVGLLVLAVVQRRWPQIALVVFFTSALWLTGSRTSLAAFGAGLVWILISPRLPVLGKWLLGAGIYFVVELLSEDYSRIGTFSDREGSDLLRSRIDAAAEIRVREAGFFGEGLGEAYVVFPDDPLKSWFFHNSYWSALVEGGWPWLMVALLLTVLVALRPFSQQLSREEMITQAAGIALLVCATRLGEVFFTISWALVLGAAIRFGPQAGGGGTAPSGRKQNSLNRGRNRSAPEAAAARWR